MRKTIEKLMAVLALLFVVGIFTGCYEPSPLYGKWTDSQDEYINFISDGTFVARINLNTNESKIIQGDWSTVDNVLVFTPEDSDSFPTEWDIRGSILYVDFVYKNVKYTLKLYHVSK